MMFADTGSAKNLEDGSIFIDRDPDVFKHVVYYLNHNMIPRVSGDDLELMIEEYEFWGLDKRPDIFEFIFDHKA